jgi:hypothetical protein
MPLYSEGSVCDSPTPNGIPRFNHCHHFPAQFCLNAWVLTFQDCSYQWSLNLYPDLAGWGVNLWAQVWRKLETSFVLSLSKSCTSAPSAPLDLSDTSGEWLLAFCRCRSRIKSIQAGLKGTLESLEPLGDGVSKAIKVAADLHLLPDSKSQLNLGLTLKSMNRLITNYETVYSSNG